MQRIEVVATGSQYPEVAWLAVSDWNGARYSFHGFHPCEAVASLMAAIRRDEVRNAAR